MLERIAARVGPGLSAGSKLEFDGITARSKRGRERSRDRRVIARLPIAQWGASNSHRNGSDNSTFPCFDTHLLLKHSVHRAIGRFSVACFFWVFTASNTGSTADSTNRFQHISRTMKAVLIRVFLRTNLFDVTTALGGSANKAHVDSGFTDTLPVAFVARVANSPSGNRRKIISCVAVLVRDTGLGRWLELRRTDSSTCSVWVHNTLPADKTLFVERVRNVSGQFTGNLFASVFEDTVSFLHKHRNSGVLCE